MSSPQIEKEVVSVPGVEKAEAVAEVQGGQKDEQISQDDESEKSARKPQIWGFCDDTSMGQYGFDL